MAKSNGKASHGINKSLATSPPLQPAGVGLENEGQAKNRKRMTKGEMKETLQSDPTKDYHYTRYNFFGELFVQNLPPWRLQTGRMMLTSDPIVSFSMNIRNAALMALEVDIEAKKPEVAEWVRKQWDFLWAYHRVPMVSAKELGYSPLQILWKEDEQGLMNIIGLKEFAPEDCRGQEKGGKLVGMTVKGKPLFFPHGLWLSMDSKYGNAYGNAVTRRQYSAWYEKWMERGAKKLQQLRMIKDAYIGDIFWYPPDLLLEIPDGQGGFKKLPWRDVLREIAEARMSGGALTLPLKLDNNGKELTRYQPPTPIPGATEIFNWVEYCDENILKGADIPYEVVQASDTGSGFSGRSIPFLVLLSVCNGEGSQIVQQTDERGIRPVAALNFGGEPEYTIKPKSLVETFSADISGSSLAGGSIGGGPQQGGVPQAVQQQYQENQFAEDEYERLQKPHKEFAESIEKKHPGVKLGLYKSTAHKSRNILTLHSIVVPKEHRGKGVGSSIMQAVNAHADKHNATVALTPDTSYGGSSVSRLKKFYKSHGYVENKGRHKDYTLSESMHRKPEATQHDEETPKEEKIHQFSCLLFNLPGDIAYEVRQLGEQIPSEDLAEDGRENNPHITLKFGLHTDETEEVRNAIQDFSPIAIQIGKASVFKGSTGDEEEPPTYDVVKLEVESESLHLLNSKVSKALECTDTHPKYCPHITIAYVKPGLGEYYAKRLNLLEGRTLSFDRVIFSNKRREWNPIKLLGKAQFNEAPGDDDGDWDDNDSDIDTGDYSQHAEHSFESKGHSKLGKLYHGSSQHLTELDESKLQSRDHGFYGKGFYSARSKSAAKTYGRSITQVHLHPEARVLHSSLHSKEAPELHKEITEHAAKHWRPAAEARGKANLHDEEMKHVAHSPIAWKDAVNRYANDKGYDAVHHSDGEVVIRNSKVVRLSRLGKSVQFAEGDSYLTRLRAMIGRGMEAAKNRVKTLAEQIRELDPFQSLQSLADVIEAQIRNLSPLLGNDLFSDAFPSHATGSLDVLQRLPAQDGIKSPVASPIAPQSTLETSQTASLAGVIPPELTKILFPPGEAHEPEIHLPAIEAAVKALNDSPVAVGSHYLETAQKVKEGSFAITGQLTEKAVADVRDQLSKIIEEGKPQKEFIEVVSKRLESEGSPLSPAHIENVFRTNTMSAYSKAQDAAYSHPLVSDAFPYVVYSATMDARVRPEHWALESHGLDGTNFYRYDDPTFKKFMPPWGFQCRCRWTPQSVEQAAKKGVKEAEAWLERAKSLAQSRGGSFYQYLGDSAPATGQHVTPPPFEPDPAFKRDLADKQFTEQQPKTKLNNGLILREEIMATPQANRSIVRTYEEREKTVSSRLVQMSEQKGEDTSLGGMIGGMINAALEGIGASMGATIGDKMAQGMSHAFEEGFSKLAVNISQPIQMAEQQPPTIQNLINLEAPIVHNHIEPIVIPAPVVNVAPEIKVHIPPSKPPIQTITVHRNAAGEITEMKKQ